MTSVLDASAGIEVVLNRSRSVEIFKVLEVSTRVYSSELYKAEITNASAQEFILRNCTRLKSPMLSGSI